MLSQVSRIFRRLALLIVSGALIAACSGKPDETGTSRKTQRELDALMTAILQIELARDPERASRLGLTEKDAGFAFSSRLTDRSQAAYERQRLLRMEMMDRLRALPAPKEGSIYAGHLAVLTDAFELADGLATAGHGQTSLGEAFPYAADHLHGAYVDVPELLLRAHPIATSTAAEDYVSRLTQWASAVDDERRRLAADARAGIGPPAFVIARMRASAAQMRAGPAETHLLIQALNARMATAKGLDAERRQKLHDLAVKTLEDDVFPAYARYETELARLQAAAASEPGVWRLPEGDAFYTTALRAYTGGKKSAEDLHAQGHAEVERLTEELDAALIAAGYSEGSVGARLTALARQPGQIYPPTEEGRAALLAKIESHVLRARDSLGPNFPKGIAARVSVRQVPVALQATSPQAFYSASRLATGGSGVFEINLADTSAWPDFTLPTLTFHETLPGHHLESAYAIEQSRLPLVRQLIWNSAYGEGWGVYAETLADEGGLYKDDPLGRIGYLQSLLFRAARLVTDTGIHRMRWTRAQAVDYLVTVTGQPAVQMEQEVDRYAVWPGQAAAYWAGRQRIMDLRERSERVLGPAFDLAAFHHVILSGGPRPLDLVEADVTRWYTAQVKPAK